MSDTEKKGSFNALLEEISGDLNKALPADGDTAKDDAKIADAAGEGEDDEKGEEGGEMAKSFKIVLEDGTEVEAVDGADLIKSLVARIEGNESSVLKVLGETAKVALAQGELIKSLQADLAALKSEGKGRKAVLAITEKPAPKTEELRKSEAGDGLTGEEFMAKAMSAQAAGRINGTQVAIAEAHINAGKNPPLDILKAVLGDA